VSSETVTAHAWLAATLQGDATLQSLTGSRIYRNQADEGAPTPYVVWSYQGGHHVQGVGTARIMADLVFQVKAIGLVKQDAAALRAIADQLDAVLQGASGSTAAGAVYACVGEQPVDYEETDSGIRYWHLGALYRLIARGA